MKEDKPHENTLKFIEDIKTRHKRTVEFLGEKIIINPNVFPVDSPFSFSSKITAKEIPKNPGIVLDVGTGTGIQAIVAAKRGAKKVVALEIDDNAIKNAKENVELHNLGEIIDIRKSDLFEGVRDNEKFNLIVSQLPFADSHHTDKISHFLFDPDFKLHKRFLGGAKKYLAKDGIILIPTGTVGDEEKLNEMIKEYGYKILDIKSKIFQDLDWKVYKISRNL